MIEVELGTYELYWPDDEHMAALPATPLYLLVSKDTRPVFTEIAGRFGQRTGVDVAITPGRHGAYHDYPDELADLVRPLLRQISGSTTATN